MFIVLMAYVAIITALIYQTAHTSNLQPADAIVVLGARQTAGIPSPVFQARLDAAFALYRADWAPVIILTGGYGESDTVSEAAAGQQYLLQQGVPTGAMLQENSGTTTWQSLQNVASMAADNGIEKIIIVSDGFHLWRAGKMANDLGFAAYTAPATTSPIAANPGIEFRYVARESIVFTLYLLFSI